MRSFCRACGTLLIGAACVACSSDGTHAGAGGGGGTGDAGGSTPTGTACGTAAGTSTGTTPTGAGCAGGPACEQLCTDAQARLDECFAAAGVGQGGAGGSAGFEFICDEVGLCISRCVMDFSCQDMVIGTPRWNECYEGCKNPCGC